MSTIRRLGETDTATARPGVAADHPSTGELTSPLRVWPLRKPAVLVLAVGGAGLLAIWSTIGLLYMWLLDDGPIGDADRDIARWLEERRTDRLDLLSRIGSGFSDTIVKVVLVAVVGGVMVAVWRRWHDGVFLATVVIFEATVFVLTSFVVGRERPPVEQLEEAAPSGSFPSGHSAAAVAFYAGVMVIGHWHTRRRPVRWALVAMAVLVPVIVAVARTYRGMHHPIDVLAGTLLGIASILVVRHAMEAGTAAIRAEADERALPTHVTRLDMTSLDGAERSAEDAESAEDARQIRRPR